MNKSNQATILGLIRGIADQALDNGLPPGRERGKYEQLRKTVDKGFRHIVPLSQEQETRATQNVKEFGRRTGWENKNRHHGTVLSMLLGALDEYPGVFSDRIEEIMAELVEHLENKKRFAQPCFWAGANAAGVLTEILVEDE